jgi:hypothetical protein
LPIYFSLDYPRDYRGLPTVRKAIVEHVMKKYVNIAT